MDDVTQASFDQARSIAHQPFRSLCYAPDVSMYFDVRGNVIACCQNTSDVLGNVNESTLEEIWRGRPAHDLRQKLRADEFGGGCSFCAWEAQQGGQQRFSTLFDHHQVSGTAGEWPVLMEFALSNRCNLACVMCSGEFSSTIRAQREGRAPLPLVYGDEFFAQLRPFLPHLRQARFFGGEPFLIPEYQRIWDLMIDLECEIDCNVTTNGTVLSSRVQDTLQRLPFSIGVSIDGASAETVESIRAGARYEELMANIRWFRDYCRNRGTSFGLTFCLMTHNWHEFADFLALAEALGAGVAVNTVLQPTASSLYRLPVEELARVVDELQGTPEPSGANVAIWHREIEQLRRWLARVRDREANGLSPEAYFEHWGPATPVPVTLKTAHKKGRPLFDVEAARARMGSLGMGPPSTLVVNAANVVESASGAGDSFLGLTSRALVDRPFQDTAWRLKDTFGPIRSETEAPIAENAIERHITYADAAGLVTEVTSITVVDLDGRSTTVAVCRRGAEDGSLG